MKTRIDVPALVPGVYQGLYAVAMQLAESSVGPCFKHLIDLRVSQMNNCLFCQDLHREWGLRDGLTIEQMDAVISWQTSPLFSDAEKAAFAWAELLTRQEEAKVPEALAVLRSHWSEQAVAELTMIIAVINAWNRVGISAYDHG